MILLLSISEHYDVMKSPQTFVIVIVQNVRIAGKVPTQIYTHRNTGHNGV